MAQSRPRKRKVLPLNTKACGLCGRKAKLVRSECCGQWICDDEGTYVAFSYARNSCARNHRRQTLCGYHHTEEHDGDWQTCQVCLKGFDPELVAWYGTNDYNFTKLQDPPTFEPAHCGGCGAVISLAMNGYSQGPEGILCDPCTDKNFKRPKHLGLEHQ